ncbi:aminoglycoside phosphotransferase [Cellulomonas bogoriensis 69B4 = DSM 16987]|uniref:Aminoglycoside phosphotransferase n=1 Tax=Cellulomonas bogoriensis 69B4 = DSM 16987 TaxID=1386082 RepID=A0A0A0BNM8_9CELL|nr:phosphotransferase [Cellulomonas bogoriensis]KGM09237.1 aminoglycoside phosphotransferase [Cellulomonas bogoriensis 69B4 = DSM 16987]
MPRSALTLAALATVAVPRMDVLDARALPTSGDVDAALVFDATGGRWVVKAPRTAAAGAALEAEVALLEALVDHVDAGRLPFEVPRTAGFAELPDGGRAVVHPQLKGHALRLERLGPGPGLAAALGRAIAALHELPTSTVEAAGLPVYDAEAYRQRRLSEVDEAARTGRVPASLLRRWERALEDVAMWRFRPTVVHGDLSAEQVLCSADEPRSIVGWSEGKVADPADDLAWLLVAAPPEAVDPILEAYTLRRTENADRYLADRALLAGELALARWLLHGVRTRDAEVVDDAAAMLVDLDEQIAAQAAEAARADGDLDGHDDPGDTPDEEPGPDRAGPVDADPGDGSSNASISGSPSSR